MDENEIIELLIKRELTVEYFDLSEPIITPHFLIKYCINNLDFDSLIYLLKDCKVDAKFVTPPEIIIMNAISENCISIDYKKEIAYLIDDAAEKRVNYLISSGINTESEKANNFYYRTHAKMIVALIKYGLSFDEDWNFLNERVSDYGKRSRFEVFKEMSNSRTTYNARSKKELLEEIKYQYYLDNENLNNILSTSKTMLRSATDASDIENLHQEIKFKIYTYLSNMNINEKFQNNTISDLIENRNNIIENANYRFQSGLKIGYASAIERMKKEKQIANQK